MSEQIEMGKQYRTRDGRAVRVLAVDIENSRPVVVVVSDRGCESVYTYPTTGKYYACAISGDSDADLIEVKPRIKRKVWINVYPEGGDRYTSYYFSKEAADAGASRDRLACVPVTLDVEEGHGL